LWSSTVSRMLCAVLNSLLTSSRPGSGTVELNDKKIKWIIREMEKGSTVSRIARIQQVSRRWLNEFRVLETSFQSILTSRYRSSPLDSPTLCPASVVLDNEGRHVDALVMCQQDTEALLPVRSYYEVRARSSWYESSSYESGPTPGPVKCLKNTSPFLTM